MSEEKIFKKQPALISHYHYETLLRISQKRNIPISRLICIAIDNELLKERIFELETELPTANTDHVYADEAGRILAFMKKHDAALTLDNFLLLRFDIGVPDRQVFLEAFSVLIANDYIYESAKVGLTFSGQRMIKDVYKVRKK